MYLPNLDALVAGLRNQSNGVRVGRRRGYAEPRGYADTEATADGLDGVRDPRRLICFGEGVWPETPGPLRCR